MIDFLWCTEVDYAEGRPYKKKLLPHQNLCNASNHRVAKCRNEAQCVNCHTLSASNTKCVVPKDKFSQEKGLDLATDLLTKAQRM